MNDLSGVPPNARVHGSDGELVGMVDAVEDGETIRLRTSSRRYGGQERVPAVWVERVDGDTVRLFHTRAEAWAALGAGKTEPS